MVEEDRLIDPSSTEMFGRLPCGVVVNGEVRRDFEVSEMTGYEEDILAGNGPVTERMTRVIYNCLVSLGGITKDQPDELAAAVASLLMPDRMFLLIAIRRVTVGSLFRMRILCPNCKKKGYVSIDLVTIKTFSMEDALVRSFEEDLGGGVTVLWHAMNATDEAWLTDERDGSDGSSKVTLAMLARVDAVNGVKLDRKTPLGLKNAISTLKGLSLSKRLALRELFKKREGEVDDSVKYKCPSCGFAIEGDIDFSQADFFFPQGH